MSPALRGPLMAVAWTSHEKQAAVPMANQWFFSLLPRLRFRRATDEPFVLRIEPQAGGLKNRDPKERLLLFAGKDESAADGRPLYLDHAETDRQRPYGEFGVDVSQVRLPNRHWPKSPEPATFPRIQRAVSHSAR